jgi:hypothetical protein
MFTNSYGEPLNDSKARQRYFSPFLSIEYLGGIIKDGLITVSDEGVEMTELGREFFPEYIKCV